MSVNQTHNPSLRSWIKSANEPGSDFPIQNLPYSVLRRAGSDEYFRVAVGIGDFALDLKAIHEAGILASSALEACQSVNLNEFMAIANQQEADTGVVSNPRLYPSTARHITRIR